MEPEKDQDKTDHAPLARSEEDKLAKASIPMIFGGKTYEVSPLVIRDSRAWRKKLAEVIGGTSQHFGVTVENPELFGQALNVLVVANPDAMIDLVFQYAPELDREVIEAEATEAEFSTAWAQILQVTFPLARSMMETITILSQ